MTDYTVTLTCWVRPWPWSPRSFFSDRGHQGHFVTQFISIYRFPIVKNVWVGGVNRLSQNVRMHMQSAFLRAYECTLKKWGNIFLVSREMWKRDRSHSHLKELLPRKINEETLLHLSFPNILYFFLTVYRRGRIFFSSYGAYIGGRGKVTLLRTPM